MNVSIVGSMPKKCFQIREWCWTMIEFCLHLCLSSIFYCWYVTRVSKLNRLHNIGSGYSANVLRYIGAVFPVFSSTGHNIETVISSLLWSLLAITILSFLSCLLSVVVCHHYYYYYITFFLLFLSSCCCFVVVIIVVIFFIPCKFPRHPIHPTH